MTILPKYEARKPGLRTRIDDKCRDCIYDPYDRGNWRKQVGNCTSVDCALWEVRPISESQREERDDIRTNDRNT